MTVTLEQLRAEHRASFIGPDLTDLLQRVAAATLRTYPPTYTPAGVWNEEAIADMLHDWAEERLIGRRDLTKLLGGARSVGSLRAGLTTSLRQYITNRQERTSATNLYERMGKLLRTDSDFQKVGSAPKAHEQLWTLSAGPQAGPSTLDIRGRVIVAFELSDEDLDVVVYQSVKKSSPVLRTPALKRFLVHLLAGAGALTPADIMVVMRRRFGLVDPKSVKLDEDIERNGFSVHSQASQQEVVRSVIARLGGERVGMLAALREHEDFRAAAKAAGVEESRLRHAFADMASMVIAENAEPDEIRHICGVIIESLFGESE